MKLVIFGSRPQFLPQGMTLNSQVELIGLAVEKFQLIPTEIVTGMAQGIDTAAVLYARNCGLRLKAMRADWTTHGRAAGRIRNKMMAMYCDAGVGLQWGNSPGTSHMIDVMRALKKPCFTVFNGDLDYAF